MQGVSSDVAARAIIEACRNQFPDRNKPAPQQESAPPLDPGEAKYTVHCRGDPTAWTWAVVSAKGAD